MHNIDEITQIRKNYYVFDSNHFVNKTNTKHLPFSCKKFQKKLIMAETEKDIKQNGNKCIEDFLDETCLLDKNISISPTENELSISSMEKQLDNIELNHDNDEISEFMDFPFLCKNETLNWIRSNLVMFVMRGLPGSGKSTIVSKLKEVYGENDLNDFVICSADQYFLQNDGSYKFDSTNLKEAHLYCQNKARESVNNRTSTVVIDNTNVMKWEMQPYLRMAHKGGYVVILVDRQN